MPVNLLLGFATKEAHLAILDNKEALIKMTNHLTTMTEEIIVTSTEEGMVHLLQLELLLGNINGAGLRHGIQEVTPQSKLGLQIDRTNTLNYIINYNLIYLTKFFTNNDYLLFHRSETRLLSLLKKELKKKNKSSHSKKSKKRKSSSDSSDSD